ncbi:O-antigen ligase family protein [Gallibacterium salpingitidis]|uniref:O-antigen ligase family protein n=1 Tax=Gallibacterium salpingitidis TaxID=505341 RepID=UPI00266F23D7|nr:O-antigen ligase family protein [Gallibacterium salpingitidis]WKT00455.1 O-antigen ligase family protein [Gallibacterium salpingitidis]
MGYQQLKYLINFLFFIFFTTIVTIKGAYDVAPFILLLISFFYLIKNYNSITINNIKKNYIYAVSAYYFISLLVVIINHDPINSLKTDNFLLLSIPLLLLVSTYKPSITFIILVFSISCAIYGLTAIYNVLFLHIYRAFDFIHPIPAGAIIITMVILCFTLSFYSFSKKNIVTGLLTTSAAIIGLIGNLLTGSRGTWLIIPIAFIVLIFIYGKAFRKITFILSSIFLSLIIIASFIPQTGIQTRYNQAVSDITQYFDNTNKQTSIGMRFELWRSAWEGIKEKPILGWGKLGMKEKRIQQSNTADFPTTLKDYPHTHNQFIEQTFYRGAIGLIVLVILLCTFLFHFIKSYRNKDLSVEERTIALLGIMNILALLSFSLSDALLRLKEYAMFFYISNTIFYSMLTSIREK